MIGTTDIPFEGTAEEVAIAPEEIDYLLAVVSRYFENPPSAGDIVHSFSGVRPLYDDKAANPSAVTRDYVFDVDAPAGQPPLLSVFGGKITTYRKLAEHALDKLAPYFPALSKPWTARAPLPGGDMTEGDFDRFHADLRRRYPDLPPEVVRGYARRYGTRAEEILDGVSVTADLGRHFGATLYEREARFLRDFEWATAAEDVLERRTKHGLHLTKDKQAAFAAWFEATV